MSRSKFFAHGLAVVLALAAASLSAEVPEWLLKAARVSNPTALSGAPAVVLLDETVVTVRPDGFESRVQRYAVRVLNRSGRESARGKLFYTDKQDTVQKASAWVIRAGKEVRPAEKREWKDLTAAGNGAVYSENRMRTVEYVDFVLIDDVFGFETCVEGMPLVAQEGASWGSELPVVAARFTLQLPANWSVAALVDGPLAASLRATTGPRTWTWELLDSPYRPDEPAMSDFARLDARLMVNLVPSAGQQGKVPRGFRSWAELAEWETQLHVGQCDSDAALTATVRKVTAGCPDALSRIRAISLYVQHLRYVGVYSGLSKGFGYRPRKATEVHAKGWGDCKDKANLMRAMLHEIGIESSMVSAQAGGGRELADAWPSPYQFNHAIVAIKVDDSIALPAVVNVVPVGRVLFFDATDEDVLLGDLPGILQGSKVHVIAPGSDALTTLPVLPRETHHLGDGLVQLELGTDGSVAGECSVGGPGRIGAIYRGLIRRESAKDLRTMITQRINATVRGATLGELTTSDNPLTGECRIQCRFTAARFAQMMPGGLAVVRLDVLNRDSVPAFPSKERKLPVSMKSVLVRDKVTLRLPTSFVVDELPERSEITSPYGHYESRCEVVDGAVVAYRVLALEDRTVPVAEYAALRKFLGDVAKADNSSVVLRRAESAVAPVK